jgi:1-acyl-sn-glycerol-3-phosphate acyltransferase
MLLTEVVYMWVIYMAKKYLFKVPEVKRTRRVIRIVPIKKERTDLDFDLGVKRVDKVRFGDEE